MRRFQQHSRSLPAVPTRYLEQLKRPKHRFLTEEREKKAFLFQMDPERKQLLTLCILHRINTRALWELQHLEALSQVHFII